MKILQIIPASGWFAVYEEENFQHTRQLVCWALVKCDDGITTIIGMEVESGGKAILFTPSSKNFTGYENDEDVLR